jgi:glycosyltransferase involved in cell wall biosynthesis
MQKPKTFIILSPGFPKDESDSTCLPAQQAFVLALKNNFPSIKVIVISFQYPHRSAHYTWKGVEVVSLNGRGRAKFFRLMVWIRVWLTLKRINRETDIAGMLSLWVGECALVGKYFSGKYNLKHKIWILGQDAKSENNYVQRIKPLDTELIAMSEFLQQSFLRNHNVKPNYIIENAIDIDLYNISEGSRNIDILGVGSLIPLKQYDLFIRIVQKVNEAIKVQSVICGKGPEENNLRTLIGELALNNVIELKGEQQHPEVLKLMQTGKIFLHTSSYEGFSSVCLEALYSGAHVISFCRPFTTAVEHWHFVDTEAEMIEKVLEILKDPATEYSPVLLFYVRDSVREMMRLYDIYSEPEIISSNFEAMDLNEM